MEMRCPMFLDYITGRLNSSMRGYVWSGGLGGDVESAFFPIFAEGHASLSLIVFISLTPSRLAAS